MLKELKLNNKKIYKKLGLTNLKFYSVRFRVLRAMKLENLDNSKNIPLKFRQFVLLIYLFISFQCNILSIIFNIKSQPYAKRQTFDTPCFQLTTGVIN